MIVLIIPYIQLNTCRSKCMFYQTGIAHKTHPDILSGELLILYSLYFSLYIQQSISSILQCFSVKTFKSCILISRNYSIHINPNFFQLLQLENTGGQM